MKPLLSVLAFAFLLLSCQKDFSTKEQANTVTVSSDANSPLNCHTLSFTSNYPVKPGEVPPFSFTKTQYPDARIKTIKMLSRKNPIYPAFAKQAVELIGTFTYSANPGPTRLYAAPHLAFLKGTSEVWEYYKTPSGTGAKRSISKKNINWKFYITPRGYCTAVIDEDQTYEAGVETSLVEVNYLLENPDLIDIIYAEGQGLYYPYHDQYGNIMSFYYPYGDPASDFHISYDYSAPRGSKNFSYIPSQNLINQEFSLLEVMQWLPQPTHQRKAAGGMFKVNGVKVYQDQVYKNYMFDAKGNQISLTYGDNVLQKTAWHCQN